jgi:hypothetical protein
VISPHLDQHLIPLGATLSRMPEKIETPGWESAPQLILARWTTSNPAFWPGRAVRCGPLTAGTRLNVIQATFSAKFAGVF